MNEEFPLTVLIVEEDGIDRAYVLHTRFELGLALDAISGTGVKWKLIAVENDRSYLESLEPKPKQEKLFK